MKQGKDKNLETVGIYNKNPQYYSEKFKVIGDLRQEDIKLALSFVRSGGKKCLEIGCGSGNEAKWIIPFVDEYTGFDASEGMIKIAKTNIPSANFKILDAREAIFPKNSFDIMFSFATFLHFDKEDFLKVLKKVYLWLNPGGVIYMTLKQGSNKDFEKKDANGIRFFYFYTPEEVTEIAKEANLSVVYCNCHQILGVDWLEIALRRE